MKDFYIAAAFGAAQVLLLLVTLFLLNRNKKFFALFIAALKLAAYVRAAYLLFGRYSSHVFHCVTGFISGVPVSAFLILILCYLFKKYSGAAFSRFGIKR